MTAILPNLYIGSQEDANDVNFIMSKGIMRIISIGCPSPNHTMILECLTYEEILDTPEQPILGILQEANLFIQASLTARFAVLVS
jgi:hypothetical protein